MSIILPAKGPGGSACSNGTCVDVKALGPDAFQFTSTIDGNDGALTVNRAELTQYHAEVKTGDWDHLLA
jgi:hypothetical protein